MRLHRLLAVLVIALSFNLVALDDAHAMKVKCFRLLEEHDARVDGTKEMYLVIARAFYMGLGIGRRHEGRNHDIPFPSMIKMEASELYYNIIKKCREEPSDFLVGILYGVYLDRDVR